AERLKAGPLAIGNAAPVARQIGEALKVGHDKGIIHGDLTPANVAFTTNDRVKVLDFGLARAMETATRQAESQKADKRTDVWAFGCVLYEMLAGKPAFAGDGISEPDWAALPADVPEAIRTVIKGCLEEDRGQQIADIPTALSLMNAPAPAPVVAAPAPQNLKTPSDPRPRPVPPRPPAAQPA